MNRDFTYMSRGRLYEVYDPHENDKACRNLDLDLFFYSERCEEVVVLSKSIEEITERNLVASIPCKTLGELYFKMSMECNSYNHRIDFNCHWISIILCIMSGSACYFTEDSVKFEKSEIDHPAWLYDRIKNVCDGRGWLQKVVYETPEWISTADYTVKDPYGLMSYKIPRGQKIKIKETVKETKQLSLF